MMSKSKNALGPTNPGELIAFLLTDRKEPYPFAKLVGLLTLCTWMRWPDDQELIEDAQLTAAASVYLHAKEKGKAPAIPLDIERLARSVAMRQISGMYLEAFPERGTVADLIAFFMHCPEELKPSLNKAYDFIGKGGFISTDRTKDEVGSFQRARTTLKIAWKEQVIAGPLLYASMAEENPNNDDEEFFVYDYAPDDPDCFDEAERFVQNREQLLKFFGEALYYQQKLQRLLGPVASAKLSFPTFPKVVTPIDPELGTFDEDQLAIAGHTGLPNNAPVGCRETTQSNQKDLGLR
jgi:hypothetical protein